MTENRAPEGQREPTMGEVERERFRSYYFDLLATGVEAIDGVLRAVAQAGKAYHNTSQWSDEPWDDPNGPTEVDKIQAAADEGAATLRDLSRKLEEANRLNDGLMADISYAGVAVVEAEAALEEARPDLSAVRESFGEKSREADLLLAQLSEAEAALEEARRERDEWINRHATAMSRAVTAERERDSAVNALHASIAQQEGATKAWRAAMAEEEARVEALEAALRPFAEHAEFMEGCDPTDEWEELGEGDRSHFLTVGDYFAARRALATPTEPEQEGEGGP